MMVSRTISAEQIARGVGVATEFLSRWPGVKRVWLFGSAAKGRVLDWRSDLDFAVEGLSAAELGRAWSELDMRMDMPADLIRWETASPEVQAEVRRWGRLLYET